MKGSQDSDSHGHSQAFTGQGRQCPSVSSEATPTVDPDGVSNGVQASTLV